MKFSGKKQILYDCLYSSFVGSRIEITNSKNKNHIGIQGIVMLETKEDFIIATNKGDKRIKKDQITFKFFYKQQPLYMDGRLLFSTLQTRIKKVK